MERIVIKPPPDNICSKLKGNSLKNFIQTEVVARFILNDQLVVEATTGFGKTNIAMMVIERTPPSKRINIVVPKDALVTQWKDKLRAKGLQNRVQIYVINTYTMNPEKIDDLDPDILIIDEAHRCLNEDSIFFSNLLKLAPNCNKLLLSASLSSKHKNYLDTLGINVYYEITKHWAFKHNLVPYHTPINVPIELDNQEKSDYLKHTQKIENYKKFFAVYGIYDSFKANRDTLAYIDKSKGWKSGISQGMVNKWNASINGRKSICYNAVNKKAVVLEMMKYVNEKCLIFGKSIDFIKSCVGDDDLGVAYHSKLKDSKKNPEKETVLRLFRSGDKPHLYSIDSIKEGFDDEDIRIVIRLAYLSTELDTIQITGRAARFDENNLNKQSFAINFYVRSFNAMGREVKSQELDWLISNQKQEHNVIWFDDCMDAIDFVKETFGNNETS